MYYAHEKDTSPNQAALFLCLSVVIALAGCERNHTQGGQTLARVNGEEITVHQYNQEINHVDANAGSPRNVRREVLEKLIDRQVLLDAAYQGKIHRSPEVIQAIERAKAQIISQAYLDKLAAGTTPPGNGEISRFFQENPEYFAERKQFRIQQVAISSSDANAAFNAFLKSAQSANSITSWLKRHNIQYNQGQLVKTSSDYPKEIANRLNKLHKGEIFLLKDGEYSLINLISDTQDNHLSLTEAVEIIRHFLLQQKIQDISKMEINRLRSLSKIEYVQKDLL